MDIENRDGPVRERIVPVDAMARWLVENGTDLGSEAQVSDDLIAWGFTAADIDAGMDHAIDRARAIRQDSSTPLRPVGDLIACALALACLFVWCIPAAAATDADATTDTMLSVFWLAAGIFAFVYATVKVLGDHACVRRSRGTGTGR